MNTTLQTIATKALPALSGEQVTYNAAKNVFLSQGYTSAAGNMYYKAIRLSNRLLVYYDLGQGYAHTFLNGIKLFCFDGQKAQPSRRSTGVVMTTVSSTSSLPRIRVFCCCATSSLDS